MLSDGVLQEFRASLRGQLLLPSDPAYDDARKIHNAMIDKRPAFIARCAGAADVIACVQFGRKNNLTASVRGGGHNVAGLSLCDGLVIDLSSMKGVHVNRAAHTARVEGGATWQDVNHELQVFGLADASYINYIDNEGEEGIRRSYGAKFDRLVALKTKYDPTNFFFANQNIKPHPTASP